VFVCHKTSSLLQRLFVHKSHEWLQVLPHPLILVQRNIPDIVSCHEVSKTDITQKITNLIAQACPKMMRKTGLSSLT
jgi:hypothetical protein